MNLEELDRLLSQLYNQAVALQDAVRLIKAGKVHGVVLSTDMTAGLSQGAQARLKEMLATMSQIQKELGLA